MTNVILSSEFYEGQEIESATFTHDSGVFQIESLVGVNMSRQGVLFDPTQVPGLNSGDIFGEYSITYTNGCVHETTVTGETFNCEDVTIDNVVQSTPNAIGIYNSNMSYVVDIPSNLNVSSVNVIPNNWVFGVNDYTVQVDLDGSGLFNSDVEYQGVEECVVTASFCHQDIQWSYSPL